MFVILGATGKVGRSTIKQLRSQGAPVRAVVRKSSDADDLSALGCEIQAADLNEAAAIKIAIKGADAVQVICPVQAQAEDAAGAMGETIDAIVSALTEIQPAKVLAISDYGAQVRWNRDHYDLSLLGKTAPPVAKHGHVSPIG